MNFKYLNVIKIELGKMTVHCVQAPESGEMVNAQLIETPNKLLLIDTLQLKPHADELRQYIQSLGKPLERILITHHHPDHWFGAASFEGYRMEALPETIGIINALADFVLDYHRQLHPDDPEVIPDHKVVPEIEAKEGLIDFDGEQLNIIKVLDTECPCNMVIELPEHNTLLSQDLIYNGAYPYFGEKTSDGKLSFDNWIGVLKSFQKKNYERIIPGHGDPTTPAIIPTMIGYLEFAKAKLAEGLQGQELIGSIKKQYPDYALELTLIMSNYMLFEYKE